MIASENLKLWFEKPTFALTAKLIWISFSVILFLHLLADFLVHENKLQMQTTNSEFLYL